MGQFKFKDTALTVLETIAQEIATARVCGGESRNLTEDEAFRLFKVTAAAMALGATEDEVTAAFTKGFGAS